MEKKRKKENILPSTKGVNLMELFPKMMNVDQETFKITPSEYIQEMSLSMDERQKKLIRLSNVAKSENSEYPPQFRVIPRILMFQKFEPLETYHLVLEVKNVGKALLPVKMQCPNSIFFSANFVGAPVNKLAPGLSVEYDITFTPKEQKDYYHYLIFTSKEETFQVPVVAIGPRPLLDVPDQIVLNPSPVKISTSKFILVRNIGDVPAVFNFIPQGPHFQVSPSKGILGGGDTVMLNISFECRVVKAVTEFLYLALETGEKLLITLHGSAENVSVRLEKNSVVYEDTFIGLKRCKSVRLINNCSNVIKFCWKKNQTEKEDLKVIESMKEKYMELAELEKLKDAEVTFYGLSNSEKHKISCERILTDELRILEREEFKFSDEAFSIIPQNGEVWPKSSVEMMVFFEPKTFGAAVAEAYLEVSGKDSRLALKMKGNALGPNIVLGAKTLDVDYIFLCSQHNYEVTVENIGDIPGTIEYMKEPLIFGGKAVITPESRYLKVGEMGTFVIFFTSNRPGEFTEKIFFKIKESGEMVHLVFKGKVVSPTLDFDKKQIDFGVVPFGVPLRREVTLHNLSVVPVDFSLKVVPDGDFPSISSKQFAQFTIKPSLPTNPKEFQVIPEESVVEPFTCKTVIVILTANKTGSYKKQLVVDLWDSKNGSQSLPIIYSAHVASIVANPEEISIPFCFINNPYTKWLILKNKSIVSGFFYIIPRFSKSDTSVTCSASIPQGAIEPGGSVQLEITIITSTVGKLMIPIYMLTFGAAEQKEICRISCVGQGPVVIARPLTISWGEVPLLQKADKTLTIVNDSPIPAQATISVGQSKGNTQWSIDPSSIVISPQEVTTVTVSVFLRDSGKCKDVLRVNVFNGKEIQIPLQAIGMGSSLQVVPSICPNYYVGILFSQKVYKIPITVINRGTKTHCLVWSPNPDCKAFINSKFAIPPESIFKIQPVKIELLPEEEKTMTLEVYHKTVGHASETFYCFATLGSSAKELHLVTEMSADFVDPVICFDKTEMQFWATEGEGKGDIQTTDTVAVQNLSVLPLEIEITTSHPFYLEVEPEKLVTLVEYTLSGLESKDVKVRFLALPNQNKVCKNYTGKLNVTYKNHFKSGNVTLIGRMNYPNVMISPKIVDFGYLPVGSAACEEIKLTNAGSLPVVYTLKWKAATSHVAPFEEPPVETPTPAVGGEESGTSIDYGAAEAIPEEDLDFGAQEPNENSENLQDFVAPTKPVPRIPEVEISHSDIQAALFPLARSYYNCDSELLDAYKLVRSSDTENAEPLPNFTKFCDITPFYGTLEPNCSQFLNVSYSANAPVSLYAQALFKIDSGPEEIITIKAISSEINFKISATELDFGKQLFCETASQVLRVENTGRMPFYYEADTECECECDFGGNFILEKGVMTVSPQSGVVNTLDTAELIVRYHPGAPGKFENDIHLQIAHLEPITIKVKGIGVFPQVYFTLPRHAMLQISPDVSYPAVASITPDWILTESGGCMFNADPLKPYRSRESKVDYAEEEADEDKWELIRHSEFMPSEIDIYLAVERALAFNLIPKSQNSAIFAAYARTIPGLKVPEYSLDFGVCVIGSTVESQITVVNFGPLPAVIYGVFDPTLKSLGISIRLKSRNEIKVGTSLSFVVTFNPEKPKFKEKYKELDEEFFFEIYHGPRIPITITAQVTYPYVQSSLTKIYFSEVICGQCKVINLRLKNPGSVPAQWNFVITKKENSDSNDKRVAFHLDRNSGLLYPKEYCTVQVFFTPYSEDSFSTALQLQVVKGLEKLKILLFGSAVEPKLSISRNLLDFKSTLPFPNKAEKSFSVSNPCAFPIEFYFPQFDEQIHEEERILRAVILYYQLNEIILPVRHPGESLPPDIVDFYNLTLDALNAKFMDDEREKIQTEREKERASVEKERESLEENSAFSFSLDDEFSFFSEKKKKKFKKNSRSRTSMEASRETLHAGGSGREPSVPSIFEQKRPEEIQDMLEEFISSTLSKDFNYDPLQAVLKSVLPPEKEEEYRNGTLIICHGSPYSNSVLLANRLGIHLNMLALSIDHIVLTEAAFGRCEAGLLAKELIEQAYYEFVGSEPKELIPYVEWEADEFISAEDNNHFDFINDFEEIQRKFNALVALRENLLFGGVKSGVPDTAKSDVSRKVENSASPGRPQMNLNAPIANITEELVVEILRYRLALEVESGLIIEGLQSALFGSSTSSLIALLKAVGNIKDIIAIFFLSNYEQYIQDMVNLQVQQEAAQRYFEEEILKVLEEEPEEVFESLNLTPEEADYFRNLFLNKRRESHSIFEKKKEFFYEVERLRRGAMKKGLPLPQLSLSLAMDPTAPGDKKEKEKESPKKKEPGKVVKNSESTSRKTGSESKSLKFKRNSVESEFLAFEVNFAEMKMIIDNWDQRLGALILDSVAEVKSKKGQTPKKVESAASNRPKIGRGIFLWMVDVAKSQGKSFAACCCYLKTILQARTTPTESDAWPLTTAEALSFSVVPFPPKRTKQPLKDVFFISATENDALTAEDLGEDVEYQIGSTTGMSTKLNRSLSSLSLKSKKRDSRSSKRRKSDSRTSADSRYQKSKKMFSFAEEDQLKPRWVLLPGETQSYRVKFYPTAPGKWAQEYSICLVSWNRCEGVLSHGVCDFPRIDMDPEVLFPLVHLSKPLNNVFSPAYFYAEEIYDFGPTVCSQTNKKCGEKQVSLRLHNLSTLPVDLSLTFGEEDADSENFFIVPDKIWIKPGGEKKVDLLVRSGKTGQLSENLFFVIKDNPEVGVIRVAFEGIRASVLVTPKVVNFERMLLNRKEYRRLVLTNETCVPLYFVLRGLRDLPRQLSFSHINGWIPALDIFNIKITYEASEVQTIVEKPVELQIFVEEDGKEPVQETNFFISAEAFDVALDVVFANASDDHIDFGDIRVDQQYSMEFNLRNVGKYQLGLSCSVNESILKNSGEQELWVIPRDSKLPPGKPFPITVTLRVENEISWNRQPLLKIAVVEPFCADELVAIIPIGVSARSHFSRYEIKPADQLNFGHIPVGSTTSGAILIENKGFFSLSYYIELRPPVYSAEELEPNETKKNSKLSASSKEKADKGKKNSNPTLKAGVFEISPSMGTADPKQSLCVNVTCAPQEVRSYQERILIFVNESIPPLKKGNPMTISAEASLPLIRFEDCQSLFREHIICRDEAEINYRSQLGSYTVYTSSNDLLSLKNFCVNKTGEVRIHLQNAGLIDCCVTAFVTPSREEEGKSSSTLSKPTEYFWVKPEKLIIEPYNTGCLVLSFRPDALETYKARLTIVLEMPEGFDNVVRTFGLWGNGILPQIEITEPCTKLPEGQVLVNFLPTCPGHISTSSIAFSNTGVLDCKVVMEIYKPLQDGVFTLSPKPGTEKMLKIWDLAKPIDHTALVSLSPGQVAEFDVMFSPREIQCYSTQIKLFIVDNPFENWSYKLMGEVFFEEVVVEKIRTMTPFQDDEGDKKSLPSAPPGQYFINFEDCYVKKKSKVLFRLSNKTEKDYFRFEWEETSCISVSPVTGHLHPRSYKEILLVFHPEEPMELDYVTLSCTLNKILLPDPPEFPWDSRLIQRLNQSKGDFSARSADKICPHPNETDLATGEEPEHEVIPESSKPLYVNLSGIADYARLTCDTTKIAFKNTFMFQTRVFPLVLENPGNVALEYKLTVTSITVCPLKEHKNSQVDEQVLLQLYRSNSRPQSSGQTQTSIASSRAPPPNSRCGKRPRPLTSVLDFSRSSSDAGGDPEEGCADRKTRFFNPFSIENATGRILPKEKATCNVVFSPLDINEYKTTIIIQAENLHPESCSPEVEVTASSIMPYCHFDVPESDYLESGRREYSRPGPVGFSPGVPLPPEIKTIEIKVLGVGVTTPIKFHGINPTEEDYTFSWVNATQSQPDVIPSFHCSTTDGWIRAGRQQLMVFSFVSQRTGITESFWKFSIPKYGVETPFLFVGDVREPAIYFLSCHVNLRPTLIGSSSSDVITLVNHEENSFEFHFLPESLYSEGQLNLLYVEPTSGKILPNSETSIQVTFTGKTPGKTSFRLKCKVKNIAKPFTVLVDVTTYTVHPLVVFEDLNKVKQYPELNKKNLIDFGSELSPNVSKTITLTLTSLTKISFYYEWEFDEKVLELRHCCLRFSARKGHVASFSTGKCGVTILFKKKSSLVNFPIDLKIRRGPTYQFLISGVASIPLFEFSFCRHDFGYCFLQEKDICFYEVFLSVRNKDSSDLLLECAMSESSGFSYSLPNPMIPPYESILIPIRFHPKDCVPYEDILKFTVNGVHERGIQLTGHGTEFKVALENVENTTVSLGAVKVGKTSTRKFSLVNKSLATATLLVGFSDQLPVEGSHLAKPRDFPINLAEDHRLSGVIAISPSTVFKMKPHETFTLTVTYTPPKRTPTFSETVCLQHHEKAEPLCLVTGCCLGPEISLDRNFLNFGTVVESCTSELKLKLINSGSIGARFEWNTKTLEEYVISPVRGYCSPESDVTIKVVFCPSKIKNCIKKSVECKLFLQENEGYPSLWLGLIGDCITVPEPQEVVTFECFVRGTDVKEIQMENPTGSDWHLIPIISGEYFKGFELLVVPAMSSAAYQVEYCPLTMTEAGSFHQGSVFFKLPNGQGILYEMKGVSLPPNPEDVIQREVPCKTKYVELLKIKNWVQYPQRLKARIIRMNSEENLTSTCTGLEYLEVPSMAQKEYALNFFAYNVGYNKYEVKFVNEESGEYAWYEIVFNVSMCGPLELITLKSGVRQTFRHEVKLENPLMKSVQYQIKSSSPEVHFDSSVWDVPPEQSVYVTLSFTPIHPGEKTETLTASCAELGDFPRELRLIAAEVMPDPVRVFEVPLGGSQEQKFLVENLSDVNAILRCKVDSTEFSVSNQGNVAAGETTSVVVTYEPTEIGSTTATCLVESEQAGNFIFPLLGTCLKPIAKGPFILKPGSGATIPFKNVFKKAKEFQMYVDNQAFFLKSTEETLLPKEEIKIFVGFQKSKNLEKLSEYKDTEIQPQFPMMGQLVVECLNPYIRWQFYLKGVLE